MAPTARSRLLLLGLLGLSAGSLALALASGSVALSAADLLGAMTSGENNLPQRLVLELRLPRALSAFACGGLLALAGALMQVLLRNPLADPYILGISGGAGAAALLAMLAGIGGLLLHASAFGGALLTTLLVFGLAHGRGAWSPTRLLLTGVVVATGWGALISFILTLAPDAQLHGMLFWLMGDLSYAPSPLAAWLVLGGGLLLILPVARDLNLLARGELQAAALGVTTAPLRRRIYALSALLTATAVTQAGGIGFVGLLAPHLLRLLGLRDHRLLLPGAVLLGGSLLLLADTLARTAFAPQQFPVGIFTALLGVPLFLYLLRGERT